MDQLNVLNIYDIFKLQLYISMYKYSQVLLQKFLNMSFDLRLKVHKYNTRKSTKLNVNLSNKMSTSCSLILGTSFTEVSKYVF